MMGKDDFFFKSFKSTKNLPAGDLLVCHIGECLPSSIFQTLILIEGKVAPTIAMDDLSKSIYWVLLKSSNQAAIAVMNGVVLCILSI